MIDSPALERSGSERKLATVLMSPAKALSREFSTPARKLIHSSDGTLIADFSPLDHKIRWLKLNELRFQHFFRQQFESVIEGRRTVDEAIAAACAEADLSEEWARKYLKSPRYKKWVQDRMAELEIDSGITPQWFMAELHKVWEGVTKKTKEQMQAMGEIGDRIAPKVSRIEHQVETRQTMSMEDLPEYDKRVRELEEKLKAEVMA